MKNIFSITKTELENYFINIGDKKFRASQIYEFLYKKRIYDVNNMNNIGKNIKENLLNNFDFSFIKIKLKQEDTDVKKYLFELSDGNLIESVLMYHDYGISICVSSQVGCNMGCAFCESGRLKKVRNLETYEVVQQLLLIEEDIKERISHVVVMGIGEPFDNYDNIMNFIKIINDPKGIDIGARHITVSTCGIVPKIKEFTKDFNQVNLAISLHAPNDKIRNQIMPISKAYNLNELMNSIKEYINLKPVKKVKKTVTKKKVEKLPYKNINEFVKEKMTFGGMFNYGSELSDDDLLLLKKLIIQEQNKRKQK